MADRGTLFPQREAHYPTLPGDIAERAAIAEDLGIGLEAVKAHAGRMYRKLGARTRAHAIALAYHSGILEARRAA